VFAADHPETTAAAAAAAVERKFGFRPTTMLRQAQQWRAMVLANPFVATRAPPEELHIVCIAASPAALLDPKAVLPDEFVLAGEDVYLRLPNGVAKANLTNARLDKALKTISTMRNWRTCTAPARAVGAMVAATNGCGEPRRLRAFGSRGFRSPCNVDGRVSDFNGLGARSCNFAPPRGSDSSLVRQGFQGHAVSGHETSVFNALQSHFRADDRLPVRSLVRPALTAAPALAGLAPLLPKRGVRAPKGLKGGKGNTELHFPPASAVNLALSRACRGLAAKSNLSPAFSVREPSDWRRQRRQSSLLRSVRMLRRLRYGAVT